LKRDMPTAEESQRRQGFYERMAKVRACHSVNPGLFPAVEVTIREDRDR